MVRGSAVCAVLVGLCGGAALAAPAPPDLVLTAIAASQRGGTVVVADAVRNRGAAAAPRSSVVYFLGGARLGARAVPPLLPAAVDRRSVRLVVPASVGPGSYRLRACVDASHRVAEANEANNCRTAAGRIAVADRTPPAFAGLASAVTCLPGPAGGPTRTSSYRLTWAAASDDRTAADGIVYDVYQASSPGGEDFSTPTYTTAPGAVAFSTPAVPDDRAYYFVVRARDAAGNQERNAVERRGTNLCL